MYPGEVGTEKGLGPRPGRDPNTPPPLPPGVIIKGKGPDVSSWFRPTRPAAEVVAEIDAVRAANQRRPSEPPTRRQLLIVCGWITGGTALAAAFPFARRIAEAVTGLGEIETQAAIKNIVTYKKSLLKNQPAINESMWDSLNIEALETTENPQSVFRALLGIKGVGIKKEDLTHITIDDELVSISIKTKGEIGQPVEFTWTLIRNGGNLSFSNFSTLETLSDTDRKYVKSAKEGRITQELEVQDKFGENEKRTDKFTINYTRDPNGELESFESNGNFANSDDLQNIDLENLQK